MHHSPGFLAHVEARRPLVTEIAISDAQAVRAANPEALLIDVREDAEWMAGHAVGAQHMSRGTIERDIELAVPDKATPMFLYCGGGFRSVLATDALQQMGYTNVRSIIGGWRGWLEANAPIERPPESSRVTGLGGVFFRSPDPEKLREWYRTHFGLDAMESWGMSFQWRAFDNPNTTGYTAWSPMRADTPYFGDSGQAFMLNYRVKDLDVLLLALRKEGVWVDEKRVDDEFGRFAWVKDGDGNRVELWEQTAPLA